MGSLEGERGDRLSTADILYVERAVAHKALSLIVIHDTKSP